MDQHLHIDETLKSEAYLKRTRGWGAVGLPLQVHEVHHSRSDSISALCCFSTLGFVDWRMTRGTFNAERFNEACAQMLTVQQLQATPVVILDNASIHKNAAFEKMVEDRGGRVYFLPPYCHLLSACDNGGFGLVVRDLENCYQYYSKLPMDQVLDIAFSKVQPAAARCCFYNCGYGVGGVCPY